MTLIVVVVALRLTFIKDMGNNPAMPYIERRVAVLKRVTAVLCLAMLVCAVTALPVVQAGDVSPPLVAVLDAQMGEYAIRNLKLDGDPWTDPCIPCRASYAALIGGGIGGLAFSGVFSTTGMGSAVYPLLL